MKFEWGMPQDFIWLWVLPLAVGFFLLASFRKTKQLRRFGDLGLVQRLITSLNTFNRGLKRVLLLAALLFIVLALCQPHFRTKEIEVERRGVDVMIAIDVSLSMLAKDVAPNRLEKAKLELTSLIERLKGDRIGIVAFAGDAFIQCPLTLDKGAVKIFMASMSPNMIPTPGTAIGRAIKVAAQAFSDKEKEFKALILLTDGEDHDTDPIEAARFAGQQGIRIFTIGIGTADGSTLPGDSTMEGFKKDRQGQVVLSKLDEPLLKEIAKTTGGFYYRSSRGEVEIEQIAKEIRQMTQKGLKKERTIEYEENFQYFLLPAFICLILEMLLSERRKIGPLMPLIILSISFPFLCGFKLFSPVQNEEGNKLYERGQIGKAQSTYEKAQQSDPGSREVSNNLGNTYYRQESFKEALGFYKESAKEEKPGSFQSTALYNLGNAYVRTNDIDAAIESYKQALRIDSRDQDTKYNLELLLRRKKEDEPQPKPDEPQNPPPPEPQPQNQDQKDQTQGSQDQQQQNQNQNQDQQNSQKDQSQDSQDQQQNKDQSQDQQDQKNESQKSDSQSEEDSGKGKENDQSQDSQGEGKDDGADQEEGDEGSEGQGEAQNKDQDKGEEKDEKESQGQSGQTEEEKEKEQDKEQGGGLGEEDQKEAQEVKEGGAGDAKEDKAKSPQDIQAEQILSALENQEKQVFKLSNEKNPTIRQRRTVEKDW